MFAAKLPALPWFRQLLGDHSPRRTALNSSAVQVRFVAADITLGQVSIGERRFSSFSIIPTFLYLHPFIHHRGYIMSTIKSARKQNTLVDVLC